MDGSIVVNIRANINVCACVSVCENIVQCVLCVFDDDVDENNLKALG